MAAYPTDPTDVVDALVEIAEAATMCHGESETPRFVDRGDAVDAGYLVRRGDSRLVEIDGETFLLTLAAVR